MSALRSFFQFEKYQTSFSREVIAGLTTFTTMSYIVVVNPHILSAAGILAGPSFVATALAAVFGCLLMGLYARRISRLRRIVQRFFVDTHVAGLAENKNGG